MEAIIKLDGLGVGIPRTGFGINAISASYIQINSAPGKPLRTYGIAEYLSVGGDNSTIVYGSIKTPPIKLSPEEFQSFSLTNMSGKTIDIEVSGTFLGSGKADVTILLIDGDGRSQEVLNRKGIRMTGGQLAETRARGRARLISQ
ncbi:hypothetical protein C7H09_08930 [Marinobacter fuscus]|uniref:Uncharacterized protein n=1 Tax=Marinobacter fuscus TaxID=2109942 RepID=A0A2T1KDS6_9GAMM|nr:hypothetical protein [Marinobacter fuscus]PSF08276.1 hypothetical protein C7H09_08930 [Marinobacter fuscus]